MDLAPEPPGTAIETASRFSASLGGSAANIAVGMARLGASAALLSAVSSDPVGEYCINQLEAYGVDAKHVHRVAGGARTSLALTEARVQDHRTVIYRNGAADFEIPAAHDGNLDMAAFSSLVVTGTALALDPSRSAVLALVQQAAEAGIQTVFDIDYRPYSWASDEDAAVTLRRAAELSEIVVGNDEEFDVVCGSKGGGIGLASELASHSGRVAIYKRGEKGSITFSNGDHFKTGIWKTKPLKPTGAGDSFLAAFLTAFNAGMPLPESVERGAAAAALVVSKPGCAPAMPDEDELEAFMASSKLSLKE